MSSVDPAEEMVPKDSKRVSMVGGHFKGSPAARETIWAKLRICVMWGSGGQQNKKSLHQ
jgi:hypothetical protein